MEYVPVYFHTMICSAGCSLSVPGVEYACLGWHANGSSRSSRQCCLSNAALRVDSVFSNDASCVAIHKSSAKMKL